MQLLYAPSAPSCQLLPCPPTSGPTTLERVWHHSPVVDDKAKTAWGLCVAVQAHNDPLHNTHLAEQLIDLQQTMRVNQ